MYDISNNSTEVQETITRLTELQSVMSEAVGEVRELLRHTPQYARADAFWLGQIEEALGERGRDMSTMTDTIKEMEADC